MPKCSLTPGQPNTTVEFFVMGGVDTNEPDAIKQLQAAVDKETARVAAEVKRQQDDASMITLEMTQKEAKYLRALLGRSTHQFRVSRPWNEPQQWLLPSERAALRDEFRVVERTLTPIWDALVNAGVEQLPSFPEVRVKPAETFPSLGLGLR